MNDKYTIPQTVISTLQMLDSITLNHSIRVAEISKSFEVWNKHQDNLLSKSALVHDIGKIYISSKIIDKPGSLSGLEREIVNIHPYIGYEILKESGVDDRICSIALYHHGINPPVLHNVDAYEDEEILEYAKMLRSIDSYEALTSDRPYRRGFSGLDALSVMQSESGHHSKVLDYLIYINSK